MINHQRSLQSYDSKPEIRKSDFEKNKNFPLWLDSSTQPMKMEHCISFHCQITVVSRREWETVRERLFNVDIDDTHDGNTVSPGIQSGVSDITRPLVFQWPHSLGQTRANACSRFLPQLSESMTEVLRSCLLEVTGELVLPGASSSKWPCGPAACGAEDNSCIVFLHRSINLESWQVVGQASVMHPSLR